MFYKISGLFCTVAAELTTQNTQKIGVKYKFYSSFPRTDIHTIHVSNRNIHFYFASNVPAPNQIFSK